MSPDLSSEDILYINQCLDAGLSDDEAADALAHRLNLQAVERVQRLRRIQDSKQQEAAASRHYTFLLADGLDQNEYRHFRNIQFLASHLPAYCQAHGLKEAEMLKVLNGESLDYKGYRGANGQYQARQNRQASWDLNKELQEGQARYEAASAKRAKNDKRTIGEVTIGPVETWTPDAA
jgi:hypothetical protein